jgi:hypothetical protein
MALSFQNIDIPLDHKNSNLLTYAMERTLQLNHWPDVALSSLSFSLSTTNKDNSAYPTSKQFASANLYKIQIITLYKFTHIDYFHEINCPVTFFPDGTKLITIADCPSR